MSGRPAPHLKRRQFYPTALVDGRPASNGAGGRLRRQVQRLLVTDGERDEAELEQRIRSQPGVTRPNMIALISPKGGVGKTTATFLIGNLLATHLHLRAVAVDANPDLGTLGRLVPDDRRSQRSLADVLEDADRLNTAAELASYTSRLSSGLHILGAPRDAQLTARLGPDRYGELVAFLATFYEVVLLDLGTGVAGPLARFAIDRADQVVVVTTPDWVTSAVVLESLSHLRHDHTTVAINKAQARSPAVEVLQRRLRAEQLHRAVTIPFDEQLTTMLDSGAYALEALGHPTRLAIKRLGLAVAEQLR
jgi:MinD-like ATPase involved in chromosome partitioning or flagellar assembly